MNEDLPARLRAAIEQRKALAEAATQGEWIDDGGIYVGHEMNGIVDHVYQDEDQAHIVANQPSAVLARCKADLDTLDRCEKYLGTPQEESFAMLMWHATRLAEATITDLAKGYNITEEET
ncbi:DUF6221 family protein [Streptosporangium sp. NBC_01755]|uniref:DUF6221 family protein n=1 Tax=unclassified Streptosporangium TaxID=2632669 RepID=UPI002DDA10B8|nr:MULTISPECIES: DUF6221 family protein [unclassified Streptosporangium]WSA23715.1 DUF6221 family protein [Streptosporangium sp. NBC_01810]WSD03825.1 DUF6221 family protein [Streptosporangium sp. NBC_01755]